MALNPDQFALFTKGRPNLMFRAITLHDPEITEKIHSNSMSAPELLERIGSDKGVGWHWSSQGPEALHMSRMHHAINETPATVVLVAHHNDQMTDNTWRGQYKGQGTSLGEYHPTLPTQAIMHSIAVDTGDPTKPMKWDSDPHWRHLPGSAGLKIETFPIDK